MFWNLFAFMPHNPPSVPPFSFWGERKIKCHIFCLIWETYVCDMKVEGEVGCGVRGKAEGASSCWGQVTTSVSVWFCELLSALVTLFLGWCMEPVKLPRPRLWLPFKIFIQHCFALKLKVVWKWEGGTACTENELLELITSSSLIDGIIFPPVFSQSVFFCSPQQTGRGIH